MSGPGQRRSITIAADPGEPDRQRHQVHDSGEVTVETTVTATDARSVTLSIAVTDTGIGIDPPGQQKLFSAFTQVDGSISAASVAPGSASRSARGW